MKIRFFRFISLLFSTFLFILFFLNSCVKDEVISTDPAYKLSFASDTVIFDTVFTTVGSTTRYLKVFNRNNNKIKISKIYLAGGSNSPYQINVDGSSGPDFNDIELNANDSLFIFVKVTIDPNLETNPLIVTDSILFLTNNNLQDIDLVAWGQDAHFIVGDSTLSGLSYKYKIVAHEGETVDWIDDKPYVIYGWAVVDSTGRLNIGPGVNVHFHQNSGLWIYRGGSLHVSGEIDSLVTFQGDRLEQQYKDLPGLWDRIWINEGSVDNEINYAVIKNGFIGIQAETLDEDMGNKLILQNTVIENMSRWGLFTKAYRVIAANCLFANCAEYTLFLSVGGDYDFRQCTFADYWTSTVRNDPSFVISNNLTVYDADGNPVNYIGDLHNAYFGNCIIYGFNDEEILLSQDEQATFNYKFDHSLLKTQMDISDLEYYSSCIRNHDPLFNDYTENNYQLDTLSPAIDAGSLEVINTSGLDITTDLNGNSRTTDDGPDMGVYEFVSGIKKSK